MNDTAMIIAAFVAGGALAFVGCFIYAFRAMQSDGVLPVAADHEAIIVPHEEALPASEPLTKHKAEITAYFGESLIFEAVCESRNLHAVFSAYCMSDDAQRRECSNDERMFYDACLGGTLRKLVDEYRATRAQLIPEPTRSTLCH